MVIGTRPLLLRFAIGGEFGRQLMEWDTWYPSIGVRGIDREPAGRHRQARSIGTAHYLLTFPRFHPTPQAPVMTSFCIVPRLILRNARGT